jgi:predicted nucleic-acid-binding protein
VREKVADFLKGINSPKNIENPVALKTLGELIKYLLTAFFHEKDENYKVIMAILHSSQFIFHIRDTSIESANSMPPKKGLMNEKKKVFLTSYLNDHGIW